MSDAGARVNTRSGVDGPGAARILRAWSRAWVLCTARQGADLSGGSSGTLEEGRANLTASVTVSTTVADRNVGALHAALEVDPFALGIGIAKRGSTDTLASRSASATNVIPHAVRWLTVTGLLVSEAERTTEDTLLSGIVVEASAGLLDTLSLGSETRASREASGLSGIPDAVRVSLTSKETLRFAAIDALGGSGVPLACGVAVASVHSKVVASVLAVARSANHAIGFSIALSFLG